MEKTCLARFNPRVHAPGPRPAAPPRFSRAVRLVNGTGGAASSGRVELLREGQWVPVRREYYTSDAAAAAVVCRQLGYIGSGMPVVESSGTFGPGRSVPSLALKYCKGSEHSLHSCDCYLNYFTSSDCYAIDLVSPNGDALSVTCATGSGGCPVTLLSGVPRVLGGVGAKAACLHGGCLPRTTGQGCLRCMVAACPAPQGA